MLFNVKSMFEVKFWYSIKLLLSKYFVKKIYQIIIWRVSTADNDNV